MISVIIPVYNMEKYLFVCLNTVLNQSYSDIEIICVNDGSTDASSDILEYFAQKDSRVKIINNMGNKGLGPSRNIGIDASNGEYIFFLDSDDWIFPNALELLHKKAEMENLDILIFKTIVYYEKEFKFGFESMYDMKFMSKYENKVFYHLDLKPEELFGIAISSWSKLYRKSFLVENNIRYVDENLIQEDNPFYYECMLKAKRISFMDKYIYTRYRRQGSIMSSLGDERLFGRLLIAEEVLKVFLANKKYYDKYKPYFYRHIAYHLINEAYDLIEDQFIVLDTENYKYY